MPRVSPAALSCFVISMSSLLGVNPPAGWLWATIIADAMKFLNLLDKCGGVQIQGQQ